MSTIRVRMKSNQTYANTYRTDRDFDIFYSNTSVSYVFAHKLNIDINARRFWRGLKRGSISRKYFSRSASISDADDDAFNQRRSPVFRCLLSEWKRISNAPNALPAGSYGNIFSSYSIMFDERRAFLWRSAAAGNCNLKFVLKERPFQRRLPFCRRVRAFPQKGERRNLWYRRSKMRQIARLMVLHTSRLVLPPFFEYKSRRDSSSVLESERMSTAV